MKKNVLINIMKENYFEIVFLVTLSAFVGHEVGKYIHKNHINVVTTTRSSSGEPSGGEPSSDEPSIRTIPLRRFTSRLHSTSSRMPTSSDILYGSLSSPNIDPPDDFIELKINTFNCKLNHVPLKNGQEHFHVQMIQNDDENKFEFQIRYYIRHSTMTPISWILTKNQFTYPYEDLLAPNRSSYYYTIFYTKFPKIHYVKDENIIYVYCNRQDNEDIFDHIVIALKDQHGLALDTIFKQNSFQPQSLWSFVFGT